jgi:hypothetical protein
VAVSFEFESFYLRVFYGSLPEDHLRLNNSYDSLRNNHPFNFVVQIALVQRQGCSTLQCLAAALYFA